MPGMDGIDLVAAWRKLEHQQGRNPTPAIVVTAHSISEYQERCRQVGVDVFLTKPVKASTLFRALDRVTKRVARVLVVDDAFDSRMLLETCLQLYPLP